VAVVTSRDVARAAGVTQSTVSYVMSGKRPISEKTRKRVEAAIDELTYHPNAGARALASRQTNVIGMVVPFNVHTENSDVIPFFEIVSQYARAKDYDVLLVTADVGPSTLSRLSGRSLCDGIIMMGIEANDARIPVAASLRIPVVAIGLPDDPQTVPCVDVDFAAAGRLAVDELADTGHRRVVLFGYSASVVTRNVNYVDRFQSAVREAAAARRLEHTLVSPIEPTRASTRDAVDRALADDPGGTGIVVADSTSLQFVMTAIDDLDRELGKDVSLIVVSTDRIAVMHEPAVSNISLEPRVVAERAMDTLFSRLGEEAEIPTLARSVELVAPRLTRRATTALFA
jgi:DNA-binding LacI/PurR family transcriptional regulator